MWAEWARATGGGVRPEDDPRILCELDADLDVLDLRDPAVREALGVPEVALVGDWGPDLPNEVCLRVAAEAAAARADGLIVPSAARPGGWTVVVLPGAFTKLRRRRRRTATPRPPRSPRPPFT